MKSIKTLSILLMLGFFTVFPDICLADSSKNIKLKMYLFAASDCETCRELKKVILPSILETYQGTVGYEHISTDKTENFKLMLLYEKKYNLESDEPVRIFVGNECLAGMKIIKANLKRAIDKAIAEKIKTVEPQEILKMYVKPK